MNFQLRTLFVQRPLALALTLACAGWLTACGGGGGEPAAQASASEISADEAAALAAAAPDEALAPVYQLTPALIDEPAGDDADGNEASAAAQPLQLSVGARAAALSTIAAVPDDLQQSLQTLASSRSALAAGEASAMAASTTAVVYTPAQIRAAYGLSQLPAQSTANKGAYQGSGQTIYVVNAHHNPNAANDLKVFSAKFGLPTCTTLSIPVNSALPLKAPASGSGCSFAVVYAAKGATTTAPKGALSGTVPAVNESWVTESALDIEWAHAIAPLARIILIEAQSASVPDMMAAVALANRMGPGIVSMSFGLGEFAAASMTYWGAPLGGTGMSYVAANGDWGSQVLWPAVDTRVLAVGGTRLAWTGTSRSEAAWTSTGGATSKQVLAPTYQAKLVKPGDSVSSTKRYRGSADVAFNADPYSGQYVYVTPSTATGGTGWIAAGGTSIGAPQWAGLLAVGNAVRALSGKAPLGQVHSKLYASVASAGTYASLFADVTAGRNGSCGAMCSATSGYDLLTGWGSPKAVSLMSTFAGY